VSLAEQQALAITAASPGAAVAIASTGASYCSVEAVGVTVGAVYNAVKVSDVTLTNLCFHVYRLITDTNSLHHTCCCTVLQWGAPASFNRHQFYDCNKQYSIACVL
jgi:hypothetical protein